MYTESEQRIILLCTPIFTCEYITQAGEIESKEYLTGYTFCTRILDLWKVLEEQVGCISKKWPKYIWTILWSDDLNTIQCGQLAGFIFVNSITSSFIVQWFGLIGLKKKDRLLVYQMVNDLIAEPNKYIYVTGYCGQEEQHVNLDGSPITHNRTGSGGKIK